MTKLTTLQEYETKDRGGGTGSLGPGSELIWVVGIAGRIPNWTSGPPGALHPPMTWTVAIYDAQSGRIMSQTGGFVGGVPEWYDQLSDRLYCRF